MKKKLGSTGAITRSAPRDMHPSSALWLLSSAANDRWEIRAYTA